MSDGSTSVPRRINASCVHCGGGGDFHLTDGWVDESVAAYECPTCGHRAILDLDPQ